MEEKGWLWEQKEGDEEKGDKRKNLKYEVKEENKKCPVWLLNKNMEDLQRRDENGLKVDSDRRKRSLYRESKQT